MCRTLEGVGTLVAKKALGAHDARTKWCQCCLEFSVILSEEVKNNPRYKNLKMHWKNEPPPPPPRE